MFCKGRKTGGSEKGRALGDAAACTARERELPAVGREGQLVMLLLVLQVFCKGELLGIEQKGKRLGWCCWLCKEAETVGGGQGT